MAAVINYHKLGSLNENNRNYSLTFWRPEVLLRCQLGHSSPGDSWGWFLFASLVLWWFRVFLGL